MGVKPTYRRSLPTPTDSMMERDRISNAFAFVMTVGVILAVPMGVLNNLGGRIGEFAAYLGTVLGACAGGYALLEVVPRRLLVRVPEWAAYSTQDLLTGLPVFYGPGLHLSKITEARNKRGNYVLRAVPGSFAAKVSTTTSSVEIEGVFEYAMSPCYIAVAISADLQEIETILRTFVVREIIAWCALRTAEDVRTHTNELVQHVGAKFIGGSNNLEKQFGFMAVSMSVGKADLPAKVQKTRDAVDEAKYLRAVVAEMYGYKEADLARKLESGAISQERYQTMLNNAMVASDNATTKTIHTVEANLPEIAAAVRSIFGR